MNIKLKWFFNSFLVATVIQFIFGFKDIIDMKLGEGLKVVFLSSLILAPVIGLVFYSMKTAGIPILNEFFRGNNMTKLLIIAILLLAIKFILT